MCIFQHGCIAENGIRSGVKEPWMCVLKAAQAGGQLEQRGPLKAVAYTVKWYKNVPGGPLEVETKLEESIQSWQGHTQICRD